MNSSMVETRAKIRDLKKLPRLDDCEIQKHIEFHHQMLMCSGREFAIRALEGLFLALYAFASGIGAEYGWSRMASSADNFRILDTCVKDV